MSIFESVVETHSYVVFLKMSGLVASLLFGYLETCKLDFRYTAGAAGGCCTLLHGFVSFVSNEGNTFNCSKTDTPTQIPEIVQCLRFLLHLGRLSWEGMGPVKTPQQFLQESDHDASATHPNKKRKVDSDSDSSVDPWAGLHVAGLCVGVGNYRYLDKLDNAVRDAQEVNKRLNSVPNCYSALLENPAWPRDLLRKIIQCLQEPGLREKPPDLFLFYYAGHAIQLNSKVYLVPSWAKLDNRSMYDVECLAAASRRFCMRINRSSMMRRRRRRSHSAHCRLPSA